MHRDKLRQQWLKRGEFKDPKVTKSNGDKACTEENGQLYIYNYPLHIRNGNHKRFRTEVYNTKQEELDGKPSKANQNQDNRNTKTRKQWKHQATGKQKINWL